MNLVQIPIETPDTDFTFIGVYYLVVLILVVYYAFIKKDDG